MFKSTSEKWIIMDVDRTMIAKGNPRDRHLVSIDDSSDKKRVLFYATEGRAKSACSGCNGFYGMYKNWETREKYKLEPVKVEVSITEIG